VETTVAAEVLARKVGVGELESRDGFGGTLEEVVKRYFAGKEVGEEQQLEEFGKVVTGVFDGEGEYTRDELAEMMDMKEDELVEKYMTRFPGSHNPLGIFGADLQVRAEKFKLLKRTRHVLSEARRVFQFRNTLESSSHNLSEIYTKLGSIMDASQTSCRDDFQCSCPELDQLCNIARKNGAYGARLTGPPPSPRPRFLVVVLIG
jgi:galactokinase